LCADVAHGENDLLAWLQVLADDIEWLALDQRFDLFSEIDLHSALVTESPNGLDAFVIGTNRFLAPFYLGIHDSCNPPYHNSSTHSGAWP
jgi:hypothetical protein